jgi:superoxide dismutase, Fe-Mn family
MGSLYSNQEQSFGHWFNFPKTQNMGWRKDRQQALFIPPRLPYSINALEPLLDTKSIKDHFYNFHMRFFEDFFDAIANTKAEHTHAEQIMSEMNSYPEELSEQIGGWYNHQLFWDNLSPIGGNLSPLLQSAIDNEFGTFYKFKLDFLTAALKHTCCGWVWLIVDANRKLKITTTKKNINPLMNIAEEKGTPLLTIDLWEHAYYGKYSNNKKDYLKAVWMLINWNEVSNRFDRC